MCTTAMQVPQTGAPQAPPRCWGSSQAPFPELLLEFPILLQLSITSLIKDLPSSPPLSLLKGCTGGLWQPAVPRLEQTMQLPCAQLCPSLSSGPTSVLTHKWLEMRRSFGLESVQVLAGIELILFSQCGAVFQTCAGNSSDCTEMILVLLSRACNNKKSRPFLLLAPP